MFCMHCGKQLDDGSRFCMYCGKPLDEAPAAAPAEETISAVPVAEPQEETIAAAPVAEPEEETVAAAPVAEIPQEAAPEADPEATMAADPVAVPVPQTPTEPQEDFYVNLTPVPEVPQPEPEVVPQDANVYADPVPAAPKKEKKAKKKGKAGPIIAIVLVLLLLIGGGVGYYLYTQHVYEENLAAYDAAELLLKKRDYDGALAGFQALEDFEDAADRAEELEQLQADYDKSLALLEEQKYDEASAAFEELGDYRDSKNYVDNEIDYQKACALMAGAAAAEESEAQEQYLEAADILTALEDYADSADLASECRLNAALIELHWADYEDAMAYLDLLNTADQTALQDAYAELCADAAFLRDVENIMLSLFPDSFAAPSQEAVDSALEVLGTYGTAHFDNAGLEDYPYYFATYIQELNYAAVNDSDWINFYYYTYYLYQCVDELYENYGAFTDSALYDAYVGRTPGLEALYSMEVFIEDWWDNTATCYYSDELGYYSELYNTSGYDVSITFSPVFYDGNGNYLFTGSPVTYDIAYGDTAYILLNPEQDVPDDWRWSLDWYYTVYH